MSTTEIFALVQMGITIAGVIILWYQNQVLKTQIKSQSDLLNTQNVVLNNIKTYSDIFDIKKINEFVGLNEQRVIAKTEREMNEITERFKKEQGELSNSHDTLRMKYYEVLNGFIQLTMHYISKTKRMEYLEPTVKHSKNDVIKLLEAMQASIEPNGEDNSIVGKMERSIKFESLKIETRTGSISTTIKRSQKD